MTFVSTKSSGGGSGGAATVATTVAGLGAQSSGALGLLRVGSSPYDQMSLVYDATYAKWVSQPVPIMWQNSADYTTTPPGAFADITVGIQSARRYLFPNGALFYGAGLRPQIQIAAWCNVTGGTLNFRGAIDWLSAAGVATVEAMLTGTVLTFSSGSAFQLFSGWQTFSGSAPTTETNAGVYVEWQNASLASLSLRAMQAQLRWTS